MMSRKGKKKKKKKWNSRGGGKATGRGERESGTWRPRPKIIEAPVSLLGKKKEKGTGRRQKITKYTLLRRTTMNEDNLETEDSEGR